MNRCICGAKPTVTQEGPEEYVAECTEMFCLTVYAEDELELEEEWNRKVENMRALGRVTAWGFWE